MIGNSPSVHPQILWKRVQSSRLALPRRLQALAQLLNTLDFSPADQGILSQSSPPSSTLLTPTKQGLSAAHEWAAPASSETPAAAGEQPLLPCWEVAQFLREISTLIHQQLLPCLKRYRLRIGDINELSGTQVDRLYHYFREQIYPILTPLAVDSAHPFPRVVPGRLYLLVTLQNMLPLTHEQGPANGVAATSPTISLPYPSDPNRLVSNRPVLRSATGREIYGLVKVVDRGPRLIAVKPDVAEQKSADTILFWREEIIKRFISTLFADMQVTGTYQFRVLCTENASNPLTTAPAQGKISDSFSPESPLLSPDLPLRTRQPLIARLDVEQVIPPHIVEWLATRLRTSTDCVCYCPLPLGMGDFRELIGYLTPKK